MNTTLPKFLPRQFTGTGTGSGSRDKRRMAATLAEGTARKLVTRKCGRTMTKSENRGDSRKDGTHSPNEKLKNAGPRLGRRIDTDISALKACIKALNRSSSPRMLRANLDFLYDLYLLHPSPTLPEHLRPNGKVSDPATPK